MPKNTFLKTNQNILDNYIKNANSGSNSIYKNQQLLGQYLNINSNYLGVLGSLKEKEFTMHLASIDFWTKEYDRKASKCTAKAKEVWFADLGLAYKPEIAFTHPVLIIEVIGDLLFIAPCTSSESVVSKAFHPIDNPNGDKKYRKIRETDGFLKDSAANLTNVRVISSTRLKKQMKKNGQVVTLDSDLFGDIKDNCHSLCFPAYNNKIKTLEKEVEAKTEKVILLESEISILKAQYLELEKKYEKHPE